MTMTKEEYTERVSSTASTLLYELGVEEWKKENPDEGFNEFYEKTNGYDKKHEIVDGIIAGINWKGAVEFLQLSDQNPDDVDSGIYEGCGWKQILICLAFEVFSWDVYAEANRMYDANEEPTRLANYPTNDRQIGYYPSTKSYWFPKDEPSFVYASDFIKIVFCQARQASHKFDAIVFESRMARITNNSGGVLLECRRIYLQGFEGRKVQEVLTECDQFGVQEVPDAGKKKANKAK